MQFYEIVLSFITIVLIITINSIAIEVSVLKGRSKLFGFMFSSFFFFLGIIIFVVGNMILNSTQPTRVDFSMFVLASWILSFILSFIPIFFLRPTEEKKEQMGRVRKILSIKEILTRYFLYFELTFITCLILVPVIWVIGASLSPKGGIGFRLWPEKISLHQYQELLINKAPGTNRPKYEFVNWYKNTLMVAIVTCIFSVIFITMVAYVFARFKFKGKKFGLLSILILQMFPSFMGLIALYNLFVIFKLNNEPLYLTFVYVSGAIPYNVWLVKGFLQNIPKSLDESAMIDGANKLKIFTKIIFPLSSPIITFLAISMFMSPWMDFMLPRMVISSTNKQTLAIGLYNLINGRAQQFSLFAAGALMVALPITILYTLLQRYLIEGITAGANKG